MLLNTRHFLVGSGIWTWGSWNKLLLAIKAPGTPAQYTTIDSQTNKKVSLVKFSLKGSKVREKQPWYRANEPDPCPRSWAAHIGGATCQSRHPGHEKVGSYSVLIGFQ